MPDNQADDASAHPTAAFFLVFFKAAAMAFYITCGLFPTNFMINFCVIAILLVCDFWTVRIRLTFDG